MKTLFLLLTFCLLMSAAHAQERTAAGALETQMTWSALKTMVDGTNDKIIATNSRLDQMETCARNGKLYSPSTGGADADGCVNMQSTEMKACKLEARSVSSCTTNKCPDGFTLILRDSNGKCSRDMFADRLTCLKVSC